MRITALLTLTTLLATSNLVAAPAPTPAEQAPETESVLVAPQPPVAASVEETAPATPSAQTAPTPEVVCHPIEVVHERVTLPARIAFRRYGPGTSQVLCVDNPADCKACLYSVPVCVPACCVGEPVCIDTKKGLLGRGHVNYRWACGFEALISFRVHGGVTITYH